MDPNELESYAQRLAQAKDASFGQVLIKAARLFHEQGVARMQADPRYAGVKARHLALVPHLDLEGTRITELAVRMEMTKQGVGQIVDELEVLGVVERQPDPTDGRAKRVHFTEVGRASMFDGLQVLSSIETELTDVLGPNELTRLRRGLLKVIGALS